MAEITRAQTSCGNSGHGSLIPHHRNSSAIAVTGNCFSDSHVGEGESRRDSKPSKNERNPNAAGGLLIETKEPVFVVGNLLSGLSDVEFKTPSGEFSANESPANESPGDDAPSCLSTNQAIR